MSDGTVEHLHVEYRPTTGGRNRRYALGKLHRAIGKRRLVQGLTLPTGAEWENSDKTIRWISQWVRDDEHGMILIHRFDALVSGE